MGSANGETSGSVLAPRPCAANVFVKHTSTFHHKGEKKSELSLGSRDELPRAKAELSRPRLRNPEVLIS